MIICVEVNVVRVDRLYPRALLTPFTDNVDLTGGDRRAYTAAAQAQRAKGFRDVDVTFHDPGKQYATGPATRTDPAVMRLTSFDGRLSVQPTTRAVS